MQKVFSMKVFSFNELNDADMNSIRGGVSTKACNFHECGVFVYCGLHECKTFVCRDNMPPKPCDQKGDGTT